jgi:phospholipid/cholesterol/gamma-HCH transport system permease protein
MLISGLQLGIDPYQYYHTTIAALTYKDVVTGLIKGGMYGLIIVMVACYEGLSVTGGAGGVGQRTTASVVRSIFLIIVANCAFTALFYFFWPE